jgi:hypothetical protein
LWSTITVEFASAIGLKIFLKLPAILLIGSGVLIYGVLILLFRVVSWDDVKRHFLAAYEQKPA